jgi:nucleoside-diphosphate-sugar epimerase
MAELVARGKPVRMVNRSGHMAEAPDAVEIVAADAYDEAQVRGVTRDAAVVYQCAQPGYTEWLEKFPSLQTAILRGSAASGARLVIGDNLYMYGDVDGPIHEGLPYAATTRKGRLRAEIASAALAAHAEGKLPVAIGRGSDFYGPWVLGAAMGERVFYPALAGKPAQVLGKLDLPHTQTFIGDFGRALVILGEHEEAFGRAWHVPNDRPDISQREFVTLVHEQLGTVPRVSSMGKMTLRLAGLFVPEAKESVEMAYAFDAPYVVDSSEFERAFSMSPTPLPEAIAATLAWYRAHPRD